MADHEAAFNVLGALPPLNAFERLGVGAPRAVSFIGPFKRLVLKAPATEAGRSAARRALGE